MTGTTKTNDRRNWKNYIITIAIFFLLICNSAFANYNQWAEGGPEKKDGASRDYYNLGARLAWKNFMGDWIDATGMCQGLSPYSQAFIKDSDSTQKVEWDVTDLVKEWLSGKIKSQGFFLHAVAGKGSYHFWSREYKKERQYTPRLAILTDKGKQIVIEAEADTYLDSSTYQSVGGKSDVLILEGEPKIKNILIRFSLEGISAQSFKSASLVLTTFAQYGSSNILIGIFRSDPGGNFFPEDIQLGIAYNYSQDQGIINNKDVIFAADFEAKNCLKKWSLAEHNFDIVSSDETNRFVPFSGKALRLWLTRGDHWGSVIKYKFLKKTGHEPDELFFRYYLRLGNSWNQSVYGGKLPGFLGTYGKAGWGGRKPNGYDGWSSRGMFLPTIQEKRNPLFGMTPIGNYCYAADQPSKYGNEWVWSPGKLGFPVNNKWYCIEQYVKLNSPGIKNGILKAWVGGYQVFEKKDILFRHTYDLKIEEIVLSLYHGGQPVSPYDQHMYIDNVVIARKYIGPVNLNR